MRLDGETPISDCLVDDQSAGTWLTSGASLVRAATHSLRGRRTGPRRPADGAARLPGRRGSGGASQTSGIHADLVRRIEAAARYPEPRGTSSFDLAYARGYAAGRSGG